MVLIRPGKLPPGIRLYEKPTLDGLPGPAKIFQRRNRLRLSRRGVARYFLFNDSLQNSFLRAEKRVRADFFTISRPFARFGVAFFPRWTVVRSKSADSDITGFIDRKFRLAERAAKS